jgi:hypothetical protein
MRTCSYLILSLHNLYYFRKSIPRQLHPLLFGGGDLVADALTGDFALELDKGKQDVER